MPVKKSAAAKNRTKRGPGRPKGSKNKTTAKKTDAAPAKRGPGRPKGSGKKNVKDVKKPAGKRGGFHREINEETGFVVDTDQDLIAQALLEGGESRVAITNDLYSVLDNETRNGTEKMIPNMVSAVIKKMLASGFTVESSFQLVPPTAASKRAATRAANSSKAPAKKTAAKKSATKKTTSSGKRGPGRPKGSKNKK